VSKGSILLVDDDDSVLVTMQAILEMDGYTVTPAANGASALTNLRWHTYDLVLTDLRMEDVDGLAVLAEVRRTSPETVAIMLTGYASVESAVTALREGAYAYLIKPCDVEELRATIARGIERRRLTQQLRDRVRELEEANATIRSLNATLQQRIDAATAELQQRVDELARARDEIAVLYEQAQEHVVQLQEVDRLKSQFLSMASHELKTPLTTISGYLQMAARRAQRRTNRGYPNESEWQEDVRADISQNETLNRQTKRLTRLIDELLDVSRIESGRVDYQFGPVDLGELAEEVAHRAQMTTSQHDITVTTSTHGQSSIVADRDHMEQVLSNLLGNAVKYSPDGGPIAVSISPEADCVVLAVQDQGVGVPESEREAIFQLFYRAPDSKSRHVGGMGLGLYISREIVRRHGGDIWIESAPDEGSTFFVSLPRSLTPSPQ